MKIIIAKRINEDCKTKCPDNDLIRVGSSCCQERCKSFISQKLIRIRDFKTKNNTRKRTFEIELLCNGKYRLI